MKQVQITVLTELALQKAQAAKDLSTVISNPAKFYVVVDPTVVVPTKYSGQSSLQDFIDNEFGTVIILALNDYVHIQTSKVQLAGTVTVVAGEKDVVGTGTAFLTDFSSGDTISIASQEIEIDTVTDDENLVLKVHHQFGATNSLVYKVGKQWWQYTSGDGTQPADYTSVAFDPENQPGISADGLYYPDPTNILTDYSANFVDDPGTGVDFYANLGSDNYFQSIVDPQSMHISIIKTAGNWALGVQANIILVVDDEGDLFAIIHSNGSDFTAPAEWSLTPEYNFSWASVLEGMIVDSVNRTVAANNAVAQIENSYQTVRQIARKMGKNADLVVGTVTQNEQQEADHLIDNWLESLKIPLSGTVTVGADSPNVVGTGTAFETELVVDGVIEIAGEKHAVLSIADDENLVLAANHVAGATGVSATTTEGTRTRVLFRIGTHAPTSNWTETEKLHFEFDRDAAIDMTGKVHTFTDITGRIVLINAANDSLVLVGSCNGLVIETDNTACLDASGATGFIVMNGKLVLLDLFATPSLGDNSNRIADTAFVQAAIAALVDTSPAALDTLNELAAALGDDENFATTITNLIATKLSIATFDAAIDPVDTTTGYQTKITFDNGMIVTEVTVP